VVVRRCLEIDLISQWIAEKVKVPVKGCPHLWVVKGVKVPVTVLGGVKVPGLIKV
jgi:hypothetical protein